MKALGYSGVSRGDTHMGEGNGYIMKTLSRDISSHKGVEVMGGQILRKICAKSFLRSVLRRYSWGKGRRQDWAEKLNSYANVMGASVDSPGSSGLQSDAEFKSWYLAFVSLHQLVSCYPMRRSITYERQLPVFDYNSQWGAELWTLSSQYSQQQDEERVWLSSTVSTVQKMNRKGQ